MQNMQRGSFKNTSIKITVKGQTHLGALIRSINFHNNYLTNKVAKWVEELTLLSSIATTQPQAAYTAFVVGYHQKFNSVFQMIKDLDDFLTPFENIIRLRLIPTLCDGRNCNDVSWLCQANMVDLV